MIVNKQNNVLDTDPKVNIQKAKEFIINLYAQGGYEIEEKTALRFASDPNLKNNISSLYRRSGNIKITPKDNGLSIYKSFLYEEESPDLDSEKKNPIQKKNSDSNGIFIPGSSPLPLQKNKPKVFSGSELNKISGTESQTPLGADLESSFPTSASPLNPDQQEVLNQPVDENGSYFDFSKNTYKELVLNIPKEIFRKDKGYVVGTLSGLLDDYGISIKTSGIGLFTDNITLTNANGDQEKTFNLFTDTYKRNLRLQYLNSGLSEEEITKKIDNLEINRFKQFQDFLTNDDNFRDAVGYNFARYRNADINDIPLMSKDWFTTQLTPKTEDIQSILDFMNSNRSITDFYGPEGFDKEEWEETLVFANEMMGKRNKEVLKRAKKKLRRSASGYGERHLVDPVSQAKDQVNELKQKISGIITRYNDKKELLSEDLGNILKATEKYKEINLNDGNYLNSLQDSGLDISDMPLSAIKINGKASSLNDLTKKLYDFYQLQEVRKGNIKIDIDDPNKSGLLKGYVQQAKDLIRTQEATRNGLFGWEPKSDSDSFVSAGGVYNWMKQSYENVENFIQGAGFSLWEIGVNSAYIFYDNLKALGVDPKEAEAMVYGQTGLPAISNIRKLLNPEFFNKVKSEYLPVYDGELTKSQGPNEILAKLVDPVANSMASTGAFLLNPYFGLSLITVSGYGGNLESYDKQIESIKQKKAQGLFLTEEEVNLESMSDFDRRMTSLAKTGVEVGLTTLFTFKYFKSLSKGLPKDKTSFDVRVFSEQYSKRFKEKYISMYERLTGIDSKLLLNEFSEEELIAFTNYAIDVNTGNEKFEMTKAIELFTKTGLTSLGTSKAISSAIKISNKNKLQKLGDGLILENLSLPKENKQYVDNMINETLIKDIEKEAAGSKTSLDGNVEYESLIKKRIELNASIDLIETRKAKLLLAMSKGDKIAFMNNIAKIEEKTKILNDSKTPSSTQDIVREQINEIKKEVRNDLSKYPSEMSYYFAEDDTKFKYDNLAIKLIQEEKIKNGDSNFTIDSRDPVVAIKAAELYYKDALENKKDFKSDVIAFEFAGLSHPNSENDLNNINNYVENSELDDFDLNSEIKFELNKTNPEVEQEPVAPSVDQEIVPVNEVDSKDGFGDKPRPSVDQSSAMAGDPKAIERLRKKDILKKIEYFNLDGNFMSYLKENQKKIIKKYFDDLKKGKSPQYGNVESILKSHEIANLMAAEFSEKIKLTSSGNNQGLALSLLAKINNASQNIYSGGIGGVDALTTDVLLQMIVKDNVKGKPFYDLVLESLRSTAEPQNKALEKSNKDFDVFTKEVFEYNQKLFQDAIAKGEDPSKIEAGNTNPNSLVNSYEQFILAVLSRRSGKINKETKEDTEFARMKKYILDERDRAKQEYEDKKEQAYKDKYETWNSLIEKLGVEKASNVSEIHKKAFTFNSNAVFRMTEMFKENYDGALKRITDHENRKQSFYMKGHYIPLFMRTDDTPKFGDFLGPSSQTLGPDALKAITRPDNLPEDMRLSPGNFFNSVYAANRGVNMEISAFSNWQTLDNLLDNKLFNDLFEKSNQKDRLFTALKKRKQFFHDDVRRTNMQNVDITSGKKGLGLLGKVFDDVTNTAYGAVSAVSLGRWSQGISQYSSAVSGTTTLLRNDVSKNYLKSKNIKFFTFTNGLTNTKSTDGNIKKRVQNLLGRVGISSQNLQNIYSKSRTGFRNSLLSELAINKNQSKPADYYAGALRLDKDSKDFKSLFSDTALYTFDQVINLLNTSNNLSLNLWLANADKLAANNAFEAHYLDYKISNGEKIPSDLNSWWVEQNKNPDIDAINHADFNVGLVMRQTDAVSEADLYQQNQKSFVKFGIRSAIPFQKFVLNAKADITNQLSILLDPNIPEEQKDFAKKRLQGRVREVMSFNIIKQVGALADVAGFGGGLALALGVNEDDIERLGGVNAAINNIMKISSQTNQFDFKQTPSASTDNLDDYNRAKEGINAFLGHNKDFNDFLKTYDKKSVPKKLYNQIELVAKDLIFTMQPMPRVGFVEDAISIISNDYFGTDLIEFSSSDIKRAGTIDGFKKAFLDNLGMLSIGFEQAEGIQRAAQLYFDGTYTKDAGDFPAQTYYINAPTDSHRKALKWAAFRLLVNRLEAVTKPGVPRANIDKFADGMERTFDEYFLKSKPDINYMLLLEGGPLTKEDYERSTLNQMKKAKE